jgi:hypothetical protein
MKKSMEELISMQEELERKIMEYEEKIQQKALTLKKLENERTSLNL